MAQWDEHGTNADELPRMGANGSAATLGDGQAQMAELIENARGEVERYVNTAADFIRARPVACVAGAVAIGFLIGKLASRGR